jgi:nicotinate-nucleotide adenylyltransferase
VARAALDQLGLDRMLWMPTGNPRYREPAVASGEHRVAMLALALQGEPRWEIDPRELGPNVSGFTVDTLQELRLELGRDTELVLLMGADQLGKLASWHRPAEVRRLATLAAAGRPGFDAGKEKALRVEMPPMAISGTDIRARVARGEDIAGLVPSAVANYISEQRLYR